MPFADIRAASVSAACPSTVMLVRETHPAKALSPMAVTPGRVMDSRFSQPAKAFSPTIMTSSGITTLLSFSIPVNAPCGMAVLVISVMLIDSSDSNLPRISLKAASSTSPLTTIFVMKRASSPSTSFTSSAVTVAPSSMTTEEATFISVSP